MASDDKKRKAVDFEMGDFVWDILSKHRFSVGEYNNQYSIYVHFLSYVYLAVCMTTSFSERSYQATTVSYS